MADETDYHLLEESIQDNSRMMLEDGTGAMLLESSGEPWVTRGPTAVTGPWIPIPLPSGFD